MTQQPRYSVVGTLILAVFCGMMLSGCSDLGDFLADILRINDNAEAQDEIRIRIFTIGPNFELRSDTAPTVDLQDGFTKYTLNDDGFLTYTQGQPTIALDPGDEVIERPASGTVTVITRD
jgi:hypothetical protein